MSSEHVLHSRHRRSCVHGDEVGHARPEIAVVQRADSRYHEERCVGLTHRLRSPVRSEARGSLQPRSVLTQMCRRAAGVLLVFVCMTTTAEKTSIAQDKELAESTDFRVRVQAALRRRGRRARSERVDRDWEESACAIVRRETKRRWAGEKNSA